MRIYHEFHNCPDRKRGHRFSTPAHPCNCANCLALLQTVCPTPLAVDWAKTGEDKTVEAIFDNGQIVSVREIRPTTKA